MSPRSIWSRITVIAIAAAVVSFPVVDGAAPACDLYTLVPVLVSSANDACANATGFYFPPTATTPSGTWKKTCAVADCDKLFAALSQALGDDSADCDLGGRRARADILDQRASACGRKPQAPHQQGSSSNHGSQGAPHESSAGSTVKTPGTGSSSAAAHSSSASASPAPTGVDETNGIKNKDPASPGSSSTQAVEALHSPAPTDRPPSPLALIVVAVGVHYWSLCMLP